MNKAFIFPGQGSQSVGMIKDFYDNFSIVKEKFQETNEILNKNLTKIIFEGPNEELMKTENAQLAIMLASIAILEVLKKETGKNINQLCNIVAGHSLGEYSALCAAESISFQDTVKLLKIRGKSFAESSIKNPGSMLAILEANLEQIQELINKSVLPNEILCIANDNTVGQIILSGHKNSILNAIKLTNAIGIKKAIELQVSGAFHSSLMTHAVKNMTDVLEDIEIKNLKVKFISNFTADFTETSKIKENLIKQIDGKVRWRETMLKMESNDCKIFIEIGNGKVLSRLVNKTCPNIETFSINSIKNLKEFINLFNN